MNTVREENKQIGGTVEELEDTIRKLLDIYEMVTRGINPFVDDAREMGGLDGGGSFGLFEAEAETEEHLDPDVVNADAETFFDDDFGELDAETGEREAELAAQDELSDSERASPADALDDEVDEAADEQPSESAGGASFDELKREYEDSGGWDDDDAHADESFDDYAVESPDDSAVGADADPEPETLADEPADLDESADHQDDEKSGDVEETLDELEAEYASAAMAKEELRPSPDEGNADASESRDTSTTDTDATVDPDAYLTTLPASYVAEVIVLEWAEHLVSVGGVVGASRALRQYRHQQWISRAVENELNTHVTQLGPRTTDGDDSDDSDDRDNRDELRIEDHQTSLAYVSRLSEGVPTGRLFEQLVAYGGKADGIRC
jgi:archaellum component FlaD/FlaE